MDFTGMTCDQIEAACAARLSQMTQAERDAEELDYMTQDAANFDAWAEEAAAQYYNLTIAEYREGR